MYPPWQLTLFIGAPDELKIGLRHHVMDQPELRKFDHHTLFQVAPLRFRMLGAVLPGVDRDHDNSTVVLSEFDPISEPDLLSVGVFHSGFFANSINLRSIGRQSEGSALRQPSGRFNLA